MERQDHVRSRQVCVDCCWDDRIQPVNRRPLWDKMDRVWLHTAVDRTDRHLLRSRGGKCFSDRGSLVSADSTSCQVTHRLDPSIIQDCQSKVPHQGWKSHHHPVLRTNQRSWWWSKVWLLCKITGCHRWSNQKRPDAVDWRFQRQGVEQQCRFWDSYAKARSWWNEWQRRDVRWRLFL